MVRTTELSDNIIKVTLNRPNKLNALNQSFMEAISSTINDANTNYSVLIIEGAGESFTAGADLDSSTREGENGTVEFFQQLTRDVRNFEGIVIGKLHGWVIGGGFEWTLSFDLRYAASNTTFRLPEPQLGVSVSNASTVLLPLTIGPTKTRELLYTNTDLSADEAQELGLVSGVYKEEVLDTKVETIANEIVEHSSRTALWMNKQALNAGFPVEKVLQNEVLIGDLLSEKIDSVNWDS